MRFGAEFPRDLSMKEIIELARICEEMDFNSVWVTDLLARGELWTTLTAIALNTHRIKLGPDVTNPFTRHPVITAHALATLQEISGGRALMGIGSGIRNTLNRIGINQPHPILAIRESVEIIKDLLSGKEISYSGKVFTLDKFRLPLASPLCGVPLFYLACMSEQDLMLASEIADGIITVSLNESYLKQIVSTVKGATERKVSLATWAIACPSEDIRLVKEQVGPAICPMLANLPDKALKFLNIQQDERELAGEALKSGAWSSLSEQTISHFALFGSPKARLERIDSLGRTGVEELLFHFKSKEDLIAFWR